MRSTRALSALVLLIAIVATGAIGSDGIHRETRGADPGAAKISPTTQRPRVSKSLDVTVSLQGLQARAADVTPATRSRIDGGFDALGGGPAGPGLGVSAHNSAAGAEGASRPTRWWVFFKDKDLRDAAAKRAALERVARSLTEKARERRIQIFRHQMSTK